MSAHGWDQTDDPTEESAFAVAYAIAEEDALARHAAEDAAELARELAEVVFKTYDPLRTSAPASPRLYEGTGIGVLYGLTVKSRYWAAHLGDWTVVGLD